MRCIPHCTPCLHIAGSWPRRNRLCCSFDSRAISGEMTTVPCVDGGFAQGAYAVAVADVYYGKERLLTASDFGGHLPALMDSGSSCLNLPQDAYVQPHRSL